MHKILIPFFLFFVLSVSGQTFSKITNTANCKAKINTKAKATKAIEADFNETVYSSMFNTPKNAKGELTYKKDDKIRWEHTSPKKQIILISGSNARFQEKGKEVSNPTANRVVKKIQGLMVQMFNGDFLNEKEFTISYYESSKQYKLILRPKSSRMSKYITTIELLFSKSTLLLDEMTMIETEADKINYTFSQVKTNTTISETKFTQF